jgi:hypothetical protein
MDRRAAWVVAVTPPSYRLANTREQPDQQRGGADDATSPGWGITGAGVTVGVISVGVASLREQARNGFRRDRLQHRRGGEGHGHAEIV